MVISTEGQFTKVIAKASILIVCRIIRSSQFIIISINAASTSRQFQSFAEGNLSTGELRIEDAVIIDRSEFTELRGEVRVVTLCIDAFQFNVAVVVDILIFVEMINPSIETGIYMPVAVNLSGRLEAEQNFVLIVMAISSSALAFRVRALEIVLSFAVPFYFVSVFLEVAYANAEVVELVAELSSQFVQQSFVVAGNRYVLALSHSAGNHYSHLITGDLFLAFIGAITIARDNAILSQLCYCIISPVVSRYIGKRICCGKSRAGCANHEGRRQCGYKSLFHNGNSSPKNRI